MDSMTLEDLIIEGKKDTFFIPSVHFDVKSGICTLEGESYLEDSIHFYSILSTWIKNYIKFNKKITLNIKLTYFNTSSEKGIFDLLILLKNAKIQGVNIEVNWYHLHDDEDSIEEAEDFIHDTDLKINLISY